MAYIPALCNGVALLSLDPFLLWVPHRRSWLYPPAGFTHSKQLAQRTRKQACFRAAALCPFTHGAEAWPSPL